MKLTVKSLQGGNFSLEAESNDTIATLKSKISTEKGHAVEQQKIIYSGKILSDNQTVEQCNVTEKGFLVLMVSKPKAPKPEPSAALQEPSQSLASTGNTAAAPSFLAPPPATQAPAAGFDSAETNKISSASGAGTNEVPASAAASSTQPATAASTEQSAASTGSDSGFVTGSALESVIQNMMEMGFERDEIQRALLASYNNPDRAVEYLMNGIPEHLFLQQQAPSASSEQPAAAQAQPALPHTQVTQSSPEQTSERPAAQQPQRPGNLFEQAAAAAQQGGNRGAGVGGSPAGAGAGGAAGALANALGEDEEGRTVLDLGNPAMIQQLQQLVQQNPAALQPLIQAIAQSNPQLAGALSADPQGVLSLLANMGGGGEGLEGLEGQELPTIEELSNEDRVGVEQMVAMGIPQERAIEAYLMCGRNVEMAVQYFFENPQDFED